jgi:hypothetical protein
MSSHELMPASSQPTKASTALPERTISSMPARNRHMPRKKRWKAVLAVQIGRRETQRDPGDQRHQRGHRQAVSVER